MSKTEIVLGIFILGLAIYVGYAFGFVHGFQIGQMYNIRLAVSPMP